MAPQSPPLPLLLFPSVVYEDSGTLKEKKITFMCFSLTQRRPSSCLTSLKTLPGCKDGFHYRCMIINSSFKRAWNVILSFPWNNLFSTITQLHSKIIPQQLYKDCWKVTPALQLHIVATIIYHSCVSVSLPVDGEKIFLDDSATAKQAGVCFKPKTVCPGDAESCRSQGYAVENQTAYYIMLTTPTSPKTKTQV